MVGAASRFWFQGTGGPLRSPVATDWTGHGQRST